MFTIVIFKICSQLLGALPPYLHLWALLSPDLLFSRLSFRLLFDAQGPNLQNILRRSYDYLTITPKLRSTYDERLIHKTSYEGSKAFLRYNSLAKS